MRIILMGTGPFAVPSFEKVRRSDHEILAVVTKPEPEHKSRKGPPPAPVRTWAESHHLPILDPPSVNDPAAIAQLRGLSADLMIVCDYGQILTPDALSVTRLGGINLHGSLLPAYRGAAPVQRALLSGDHSTGVCVIHMTPRLDGGPVLASAETPIGDDETSGELEERLSQLGVELVLQSISRLAGWDGKTPIGEPQDPEIATKAPRLNKSDGRIDWDRTPKEIDVHVRGMQPWPVAFTFIKPRENKPALRLAILELSEVDRPAAASAAGFSAGQIAAEKDLVVIVRDGAVRIDRVRPAGKREMSGEEFLRGHQLKPGTRFQDQ